MKVFVDVGGFKGDASRAALDPLFNFDRVSCFEPVSACCENNSACDIEQLALHVDRGCLSDSDGTVIPFGPGTNAGSLFPDHEHVDSSKTTTVRLIGRARLVPSRARHEPERGLSSSAAPGAIAAGVDEHAPRVLTEGLRNRSPKDRDDNIRRMHEDPRLQAPFVRHGARAAYAETGNASAIIERARHFESFEDWPWCLAYRELDVAFPGSLFVVTRRMDVATYVDSSRRHSERHGQLEPVRAPEPDWWRALFPEPYGSFDAEACARRYETHYAAIGEYFAGREDVVLEVCWEHGDDWRRFCAFVGRPKPALPFPHANRG